MSTNRRRHDWIGRCSLAAGLLCSTAIAAMQAGRTLKGLTDFTGLFIGGKLAGTAGLYDRAANVAAIRAIHGLTMQNVGFCRPPFYAVILKPLAALPYLTAFACFSAVSFACLLWFVIAFRKECPELPVLAAFSIPAVECLCCGQDASFLLAAMGAAILLSRRGLDFSAGAVLSLGLIKFHLLLFLPLHFLIRKRYRLLAGGACGCAALIFLGLLGAGAGSWAAYAAVLRDGWINPPADSMPNIHGLVARIHAGTGLEVALVLAVAAAFLLIEVRTEDEQFALATAIVCGLLVSVHSWIADDLLLLLVPVLIKPAPQYARVRVLIAAALTPVPYILFLTYTIWTVPLPAMLLAAVFAAATAVWRPRVPALRATPA